jgi:MtN3 and saliva related transmembrane protein
MHANSTIARSEKAQITMDTTDWIGSAAATLTTTAFIPQAWKIWHTRHTADISLGMYALFTTGVALWLTYGILLAEWPIIIANSITLLLAGSVLVMKLKFG